MGDSGHRRIALPAMGDDQTVATARQFAQKISPVGRRLAPVNVDGGAQSLRPFGACQTGLVETAMATRAKQHNSNRGGSGV